MNNPTILTHSVINLIINKCIIISTAISLENLEERVLCLLDPCVDSLNIYHCYRLVCSHTSLQSN